MCEYSGLVFCEEEVPAKHMLYMFLVLKNVKVPSEGYRKWQGQAEKCWFGKLDSSLASIIVMH